MQREMTILGTTRTPELIEHNRVTLCDDFVDACLLSVRLSSAPDYVIADAVHMDAGNFSRFLKGNVTKVFRFIVNFMNATGNYAPLQWLAWRCGFRLVEIGNDDRIRELEEELDRLRRSA